MRLSDSMVLITSLLLPIQPQGCQAQQPLPNKPPINVTTSLTGTGTREDWRVLQLPESGRPHIDAELLTSDQHPGFTRQLVRLEWRVNDGIDLWIVKPEGVKHPSVVLYLYSYPSTNDRYQDLQFCKFLTKNQVAAVGFVSALTGQRYHDRPMKEWFVSNLQEVIGTTVHDVQMVLDYLAKRGDLDMNRVGMFGDGSGATIAIMAAAVDSRIKVLDVLNPWGDWPDWLADSTLVPEDERGQYLKPDFLKSVEDLDPVRWLPKLKTQAVRLQYIKDGVSVTPNAAKERMLAAAPRDVTIVRYQDTQEFIRLVASTGKGFDWIDSRISALPIKTAKTTDRAIIVRGNPSSIQP